MSVEHTEEVREVAFSPDGRYLAAISTAGRSACSTSGKGGSPAVGRGDAGLGGIQPDGMGLATASGDHAKVWDLKTGQELFSASHLMIPPGTRLVWVDDVAFSDGVPGHGGRDRTARVWNVRTGRK
jgi:WD40 repeat protein